MKLFKNECAEIILGLTIMFSVFFGAGYGLKKIHDVVVIRHILTQIAEGLSPMEPFSNALTGEKTRLFKTVSKESLRKS